METIKIPEQIIVINDQANIDLRQILQALNIKFDCEIINPEIINPNKTVSDIKPLVNNWVKKYLFKAYNIPCQLPVSEFIRQFPRERVCKIEHFGRKSLMLLEDALETLGYDYY